MDGTKRSNLKIGQKVMIILKQDQRSGKMTEGVIARFLTKSPQHSRGIKVKLQDGQVGRVQKVMGVALPKEPEEDVWSLINRVKAEDEEERLGDDW
ncbi:UNVERIFIED_CONTAM: hypothetical protein GTU68_029081 [Idotea baltica]|nr:hypothetical protein [Idotea baltica]